MIIYQWKNRPRKYDEIKATHLLWSDRMSENEDFRDDDSDGDEDVKGRQILNYMVDDFRVFLNRDEDVEVLQRPDWNDPKWISTKKLKSKIPKMNLAFVLCKLHYKDRAPLIMEMQNV